MEGISRRITSTIRIQAERLMEWAYRQNSPEWAIVMGTALIVGIGAGLGAVIFRALVEIANVVFLGFGAALFGFLGDYYILVIPAAGALAAGPLVYYFAREAKGHGVPEVMKAVALKGGRIRPRVAVIKSLASALTIGSGGSVGSEGPIVQIGSAIGSTVGQFFRLSEERVRSLVACGAAGGIAAIFNAPIAGAIFALEVILGEFRTHYFGAVVISAVIADVVAHAFLGAERALNVPNYQLHSAGELLLYALLGVLAAGVSVLYTRVIDRSEDVFDNWQGFPEALKPMIGGLGVGIVGVVLVAISLSASAPAEALTFLPENTGHAVPSVFGVGYETISIALFGQMALGSALLLLAFKLAVTTLTLGSGGSGGVFAPALFLGAMFGLAFGHLVNAEPVSGLFLGGVGAAGAYALVGMAAVFAGSTHAPATAILILFEMTGSYDMILPLMFATVIAVLISRALEPESIYTIKLAKQGIRLQSGRDVDLLEGITVGEAMSARVDTVRAGMPLSELNEAFTHSHHHGFPVLDEGGALIGIVTVADLDAAIESGDINGKTVRDIATTEDYAVAFPDESLGMAMLRMGVRGVGRLPVVAEEDPSQLLGILRRHNIVSAYNKAITRRTHIAHRLRALEKYSDNNVNLIEIHIAEGMDCVGQTLRDIAIDLPTDSIVASIRRSERTLIPHGSTILQAGDRLVVLVAQTDIEAVRDVFC